MMADTGGIVVGTRVEVSDKGVKGVVAYIGTTEFASGAWVGIVLDEPKGKNNGTVNGKSYFKCTENHGMFKRAQDLTILTGQESSKKPSPQRPDTGGTPDGAGKGRGSRLQIQKLSNPSLSKSQLKPMNQAQRRNQLTRYFSQFMPQLRRRSMSLATEIESLGSNGTYRQETSPTTPTTQSRNMNGFRSSLKDSAAVQRSPNLMSFSTESLLNTPSGKRFSILPTFPEQRAVSPSCGSYTGSYNALNSSLQPQVNNEMIREAVPATFDEHSKNGESGKSPRLTLSPVKRLGKQGLRFAGLGRSDRRLFSSSRTGSLQRKSKNLPGTSDVSKDDSAVLVGSMVSISSPTDATAEQEHTVKNTLVSKQSSSTTVVSSVDPGSTPVSLLTQGVSENSRRNELANGILSAISTVTDKRQQLSYKPNQAAILNPKASETPDKSKETDSKVPESKLGTLTNRRFPPLGNIMTASRSYSNELVRTRTPPTIDGNRFQEKTFTSQQNLQREESPAPSVSRIATLKLTKSSTFSSSPDAPEKPPRKSLVRRNTCDVIETSKEPLVKPSPPPLIARLNRASPLTTCAEQIRAKYNISITTSNTGMKPTHNYGSPANFANKPDKTFSHCFNNASPAADVALNARASDCIPPSSAPASSSNTGFPFPEPRTRKPSVANNARKSVNRSADQSLVELGVRTASRNSLAKLQLRKVPTPRKSMLGLPVAGLRDPKEPVGRKSLQSTPSGSRSNLAPSASKTDLGSKRPSFVETGFSESIVPQYTPGTPGSVLTTPIMTPASSGTTNEDRFSALQLNESLRNEVKDLTEKLESLKAKRAGDVEKLRELERLRIQVDTLNEFKSKVLESQASLQRDLNKAKQEARDAIEAREIHAEEMSDLSEAVEMATLDKEMAEEKAETLQMELDQAQEKIAELQTELNAYKDEASGKVDPETGEVTRRQVKQLQDDNARYRDALVKLRDASAHEKHQHQKSQKEVETLKHEAQDLQRTKERLEDRMIELESQVADLQELNDAALGAEEMLEALTEKNLNLEEKVNQLTDAVADLEALQDINEQLQESAKEIEVDLRNDLQHSQTEILEMRKQRQTLLELIADKEGTIFKFREHVKQLSEELAVLRRSSEEETAKSMPGLTEALDFKKVFAETKAQTTAIDLELRRLEAREATLHVKFLSSFMPEGFMKRGGDNDALLVLLLVPRLVCKAELLLTQVKQKLIPVHLIDVVPSSEEVAVSPDVEQYAFSMHMCFLLNSLLSELRRWHYALNTCTPEEFLKLGILLPELSVQEKSIDFYLELLRKSQLDENISLAGLEKCIAAFQNFFNVHLTELYIEPSSIVTDQCAAAAAASDCVIVDANRLSYMLKKSEKESGIGLLLQDLKTIGESVRQIAKRTPRYLPDLPKQPPVSSTLQSRILQDCATLSKTVKALQEVCKQAIRHSDMLSSSGVEGLPGSKMEEFFNSALAQCEVSVEGGDGVHQTLKGWLTTVLMTMTDLAQVVNEAPNMSKDKPPAPVSLRAEAVKAELDLTRNLKIQLEDKEVTIKEMKSVLAAKKDELSQAVIRKDLAEKKLSNLTKEHEMVVEKLERKLEDTKLLLDRKQREFDATLEHFQTDLQSLESENKEWKDKVRSFQKSTILANLDSMIASSNTSPLNTPSHTVIPSSTPSHESPQALTSGPASAGLIDYTRFLQRENWRLRSEKLGDTLRHLPPLVSNRNNMDILKSLDKEFWSLKREWINLLGESVKLAYDKTLSNARKEYYGEINEQHKRELLEKMAALKDKINQELAKENSGSMIKSDLTTFCAAKCAEIADAAKKVGALRFAGWDKSKESPKKVVLTQNQLNELHKLLAPF